MRSKQRFEHIEANSLEFNWLILSRCNFESCGCFDQFSISEFNLLSGVYYIHSVMMKYEINSKLLFYSLSRLVRIVMKKGEKKKYYKLNNIYLSKAMLISEILYVLHFEKQ